MSERRGVCLTLNADLPGGGYVNGLAYELATECDYRHRAAASYPTRQRDLPDENVYASERGDSALEVLFRFEQSAAYVQVSYGAASIFGLAGSPEDARLALERAKEWFPREESLTGDVVPVTFWSYSPHGPQSIRRDLDAPSWDEVEENYPRSAREELRRLVGSDFSPAIGGQLLLWAGEPGTGKTTALRMLAREWREWCDLHYIADPDNFFGSQADYMLGVMLREEMDTPGGSRAPDARWRVLVLEDAGELLRRDAKREVGQALSRFLNAVDGMIGRGLRVLVLVTTNEDVGSLHPAVARPGRCASEIEFPRFSREEADAWLDHHDLPAAGHAATLAELYAEVEGFSGARQRQPVGFGSA